MSQTIIRIAAWGSIVAIFIMTDAPIALRPWLGLGANVERFLAFAFVGGLFVLAYPRRPLVVLVCLIAGAALFEVLQMQALGRHGRVIDFLVKAAGACAGIAFGMIATRLRDRKAQLSGP